MANQGFLQAQTQSRFFHPSGEPPVPSFLLTQNLPPKDIAGSDVTKLMTSYEVIGQEIIKGHPVTLVNLPIIIIFFS